MRDEWEIWRLCEALTIAEAACLIAGIDPADAVGVEKSDHYKGEGDGRFTRYVAARQAISRALAAGKLSGQHIPEYDFDINGNRCDAIEGSTDTTLSTVEVESLRDWLRQRGYTKGFFFPDAQAPDYLNSEHPRYAPKLAAAVSAWLDVGEVTGRSAKSALDKWLREHAAQFGLTKDDGNPNETGIEEVAKVANWQPGGAPKTPG